MTDSFDPYHLLLSVASKNQPPNHYQLLGIERLELSADVISNAAERQCDQLRRHSGGKFNSVVPILESAVQTARDCLLNRDSHRRYAADFMNSPIAIIRRDCASMQIDKTVVPCVCGSRTRPRMPFGQTAPT